MIDFLIKLRLEKSIMPIDYKVNKYFEQIKDVINSDSEVILQKSSIYCKKWYGRQKSLVWYSSHNNPDTTVYKGYWIFDLAAILKLKGCNLGKTKFGQYFPYSFFNLPEQNTVPITRIEKGCKRVYYPDFERLSIDVPNDFETRSQDRLLVSVSPNDDLQVAATIHSSMRTTLTSFHKNRIEEFREEHPYFSIKEEPFKSKIGKFDCMTQDLVGFWPNYENQMLYRAISFGFSDNYVEFGFILEARKIEKNKLLIEKISKSLRLSK